MLDKEYRDKANLAELNNLHGKVAAVLAENLDDPKILANAIKFLKDNNVTADVMESESMQSLADSIKQIAKEEEAVGGSISIEELLGSS